MANTNLLPYFNTTKIDNEKQVADYLKCKFSPSIKKRYPSHYAVSRRNDKTLKFIMTESRKYPYFLKIDIERYFPSVNHQILIQKLPAIFQRLTGKPPPRKLYSYLKKELPEFLSKSPYQNGIPIGSALSHILAIIYLLEIELSIPNPLIRCQDDYLIFCKDKTEPQKILKDTILPILSVLCLQINEKKLSSGKFYKDRVSFVGFDYYSGYFQINGTKKERFKEKITRITHLTKKKPVEAVTKLLNNAILGFGHYYKFASTQQEFTDLDAFIRQRLRRYISRHKNSCDRQVNLLLTNSQMETLGLKSLVKIRERYTSKKRVISGKKMKIKVKVGKYIEKVGTVKIQENSDRIWRYAVLKELKMMTKKLEQIEKRVISTERKMDRQNK